MSDNVRGIYRTLGFAFVTDGKTVLDIPEAEYRDSEYAPVYGKLPSEKAYQAGLKLKGG
jgi:hypothetical protein